MDLTLVDIIASAIVVTQFEARLAAAFVGAPIVYTAMLTQAWEVLALVHVHTFSIIGRVVLKSGLAVTAIGTDAVYAFGVGWARSAVFVELALVDVLAVLIVRGDKSGGTDAGISARLVFACLLWTANRLSCRALIDVNALRGIGVQLKASLTVDSVDAAEGAVGIDALLASCAWISHLTLIDVLTNRER